MPTVAIIGSGIAGLSCAWFLRHDYDVTVFESDAHIGGHANTVWVDEGDRKVPVDTGFMVFNQVTYPHLTRLFRLLDVPIKPTDMSFSVRHGPRVVEYRGSDFNTLFAQRRNLFRPSYYRLLWQIDRFNREAVAALEDPSIDDVTLAEYVAWRGYGADFLQLYLVPMSSAVWSTPPEKMLRFPAATLLRFFHNHGFLGMHTQHPWWTIEGGSRAYVERLTADFQRRIFTRCPVHRVRRTNLGVTVETPGGSGNYDHVIFACHPPAALKLLGDEASDSERRVLSAFKYQANAATLHTDVSVMPRRQLAWSAWNYRVEAAGDPRAPLPPVTVSTHYWMNRLQGVSDRQQYFVSLNADRLIDASRVLCQLRYEHPLFDLGARRAQGEIGELNRQALLGTWTFFAGAWQCYGFHEDGIASAVELCRMLLRGDPWVRRRVAELV